VTSSAQYRSASLVQHKNVGAPGPSDPFTSFTETDALTAPPDPPRGAADERLVIAVSQDRMAIEEASVDRPGALAPVDARLAAAHLSILALLRIADSHDGRVSVVRSGAGARVSIDLSLDAAHG
jgi:hypothetical protein